MTASERGCASRRGWPLENGESILWAGRPRQGLRLQPLDSVMIPVGLGWAGLGWYLLAHEVAAAPPASVVVPRLLGVVLAGYACFLLFIRFVIDAIRRARTEYVVTDRRALTRVGSQVSSLALVGLQEVNVQECRDGRGTLWLGRPPGWARSHDGSYFGLHGFGPAVPRLDSIEDPHRVRELLLARAAAAGSTMSARGQRPVG